MSKIIAVMGATGTQGGSVVSSFLKQGEYKVRGITRNANSDKAKALSAKGVEMVTADLDNEASLVKAFEGVTAVFAVTDFYDAFGKLGVDAITAMDLEYQQGVRLANAALQTPTLEHFIWSTLPDSGKITGGKFPVPHFDGKAKIDEYIKSKPELLAKTTFLWVTLYPSNFFYPPMRAHHLKSIDTYAYIQPVAPSTPLSVAGDISVNVGVVVKAIVSNPSKTLGGKYVLLEVQIISNGEYLQLWGKVTGRKVHYLQVSLEEYNKLFPKWGAEVVVSMQYFEYATKVWSGDKEPLTAADLGVQPGELATLEKAFETIDWSAID